MMKTYKSLSQYKQLIYGIKGISASPHSFTLAPMLEMLQSWLAT